MGSGDIAVGLHRDRECVNGPVRGEELELDAGCECSANTSNADLMALPILLFHPVAAAAGSAFT